MSFDKDNFLLRADEGSELLADAAMDVIRQARLRDGETGPLPDPYPISHRNLRLTLRAAYKAGATFGLAEFISILAKDLESDS